MGRLAGLLSVVWVALLLLCGPASASLTQESVFMDDNRILYRGDDVGDKTLQELKALGVTRVRLSVVWRNIAPKTRPSGFKADDPAAYDPTVFDNHDHVLRVAHRLGMEVLFDVVGGAPDWAAGKPLPTDKRERSGDVRPNATQFRLFVAMLGRRYSGSYADENQGKAQLPKVSAWSIWNEPNRGAWLAPQWQRDRRTRKWQPVSHLLYRSLVRAAVDGLHRTGHGDDTILLGETAPLGNRGPGPRSHIKPVPFLRELFCLRPDLRPYTGKSARRRKCDYTRRGPLQVTGFAHHPYSVVAPPSQQSADGDVIALGDLDRLAQLLDAAARAGRIPANLPIWITEYGYQTNPPDPLRGVALDQQARWLADAEELTRANPRVVAHTQFLLRDDEPQRGYPESDSRYWSTYQSGLQFADGAPKPALDAYRLPLTAPATIPSGTALHLWGLVRPLPGVKAEDQHTVRVQHRTSASSPWGDVTDVQVTDPTGVFGVDLQSPVSGDYRFLWPVPQDPPPRPLIGPAPPAPAPPFASEPVTVTMR